MTVFFLIHQKKPYIGLTLASLLRGARDMQTRRTSVIFRRGRGSVFCPSAARGRCVAGPGRRTWLPASPVGDEPLWGCAFPLPPVESVSLGGRGKVFIPGETPVPTPLAAPSLLVTPTSCRHCLASSCELLFAPSPALPSHSARRWVLHGAPIFSWRGRKLKYCFEPHAPPPYLPRPA